MACQDPTPSRRSILAWGASGKEQDLTACWSETSCSASTQRDAPDARAPEPGQYGQADGELDDTEKGLEEQVPVRSVWRQYAHEFEQGGRYAYHACQEGDQDQPKRPPPPSHHT